MRTINIQIDVVYIFNNNLLFMRSELDLTGAILDDSRVQKELVEKYLSSQGRLKRGKKQCKLGTIKNNLQFSGISRKAA